MDFLLPSSPLSTNAVEISREKSSSDEQERAAAIQRIQNMLTSDLPYSSDSTSKSQPYPAGYVSEKIQIHSQPRERFRPRTKKESEGSSHYIRSDDSAQPEYPSIKIPSTWENINNIIELTLVDKKKNPHPYTIDTKERRKSKFIFKINESQTNTLYFYVTNEDFTKGFKTFTFQYIKPKQNEIITKALIESSQLDQSMICFTRCYETSDGHIYRDNFSSEYSSLMIEDYGPFHVEDVFPLYGSMTGNDKIAVELKGHVPKDIKTNTIVYINGQQPQWSAQTTILDKRGNNLTFRMPPCPLRRSKQTTVDIVIRYNEQDLYQSNYVYISEIDSIVQNNQ